MKGKSWLCLWLLCVMGLSQLANSKEWVFALVPKKASSPFYMAAGEGCEAAAKALKGVTCIFRGSLKTNDVRKQDKILSRLIDEGIDGIAIAVTQSEFLADNSMRKAYEAGIPVVAFDADFNERHQYLRKAYVGTNNLELGRALGEAVQKLRPQGAQLCIHTGRLDSPNLNLRIMGLRSVLSGNQYQNPPGRRLTGENGYSEWSRCPLPHLGDFNRAISQMQLVFEKDKSANTLIGVGGGPQNAVAQYQKLMLANKKDLDSHKFVVVFADTNASQLGHLRDGLSHYNVGQNPYDMGREAILTLHKIVTQKKYSKTLYTPLTHCTPENYRRCTQ
ncbi:MAG: substrate-binding domain-containing protein [Bermanella sp.]